MKNNFNLNFPVIPMSNISNFLDYLNNYENNLLINYNTSVFLNHQNNSNFNLLNFQTLCDIECKSDILSILNLHKKIFAIGFKDGKIRLYNQISFKRLFTIKAHNNFVFDLILFNNKYLISCGRYNKINIINLKNFSIIDTLTEHNSDVLKIIEFKNNKVDFLLSCSEDQTIKVWNQIDEKFNLINTIQSEFSIYSILQIKLNEFIYLTGNNFVQSIFCYFYDIEKNKIVKEICSDFSTANHSQILLNKNLLCLGGNNNTINVIDINNHNLIFKFNLLSEKENNYSIKSILNLNENYLMCGNYEGKIIICKITNEKIIVEKIFKRNINCINSIIYLDNNLIISGGNYGHVVIYKY
jgi:WD40 repeat protein